MIYTILLQITSVNSMSLSGSVLNWSAMLVLTALADNRLNNFLKFSGLGFHSKLYLALLTYLPSVSYLYSLIGKVLHGMAEPDVV